MGILDRVNKVWSGADFWDKKENAKQKAQFDAEEEKRKKREAQANKQPTVVTPTKPPKTVATPGLALQDPMAPFKIPEGQAKAKPVDPAAKQKYQDLKSLEEKQLPRALDEIKRNQTSWGSRTFTDRNWDERAKALAIQRANTQYQEKNGYNNDPVVRTRAKEASTVIDESRKGSGSKLLAPVLSAGRVSTGLVQGAAGLYDIMTPGVGTNRLSQAATKKAEEQDQLAKDLDIEGAYKTGNVVGEIASYAIPGMAGVKASKAGTAAVKTAALAAPNFEARALLRGAGMANSSKQAIINLINNGGDANKIRQFIASRVSQNFTLEEAIQELMITGRYMGQNTARGGDTSIQSVATDAAMGVAGALVVPARGIGNMFNTGTAADDAAGAGLSASAKYLDDVMTGEQSIWRAPGSEVPGTKKPRQPRSSAPEVAPGVKAPNLVNGTPEPNPTAQPLNPPGTQQVTPTTPPVVQPPAPITPQAPVQQAVPQVSQNPAIDIPRKPVVLEQPPLPTAALPEAAPATTPIREASQEVIDTTAPIVAPERVVPPPQAPIAPVDEATGGLRATRESLLAERDARIAEGLPTLDVDRQIARIEQLIADKVSGQTPEARALAEGEQQLAEAVAPAKPKARATTKPEITKQEAPSKPKKDDGTTTKVLTPEEMKASGNFTDEMIANVMARRAAAEAPVEAPKNAPKVVETTVTEPETPRLGSIENPMPHKKLPVKELMATGLDENSTKAEVKAELERFIDDLPGTRYYDMTTKQRITYGNKLKEAMENAKTDIPKTVAPEPATVELPKKPTQRQLNNSVLDSPTTKSGKVTAAWKNQQRAAGATDEQIAKAVEKVEGRKVEPTAEEKITAEQRAKANEIAKREKAKAKAEGKTEIAAPNVTKAMAKNTTEETGDDAARAAIERASRSYKKDFNFEVENKKAQDIVDAQSDGNVLKWAEDVLSGKKKKEVSDVNELILGDAITARLEKLRRAGTLTYDDTIELLAKAGRNRTSASSEAGLINRIARELQKSLPSPVRVNKEIEKLTEHFKKLDVDFKVSDDDTKALVKLTDDFDTASTDLTGLEQEMAISMADMLDPPEGMTPKQISEKFAEKAAQRKEAQVRAVDASKAYIDKLNSLKPKLKLMDRAKSWAVESPDVAGNYLRMSMLSAPSGRVRDMISTGVNTVDQVGRGLIESLTGKASNKLFGTHLESNIVSGSALKKGVAGSWDKLKASAGGRYTLDEATGKVGVTDRSELRAGDGISHYGVKHGKYEAPRKGVSKWARSAGKVPKRVIATLVQAPTDITYTAYTKKLYSMGLARAEANGLSGNDAKLYANMFMEQPDQKSALKAADTWLENSAMHDNFISRFLTREIADKLDAAGTNINEGAGKRFAKKAVARTFRTTTIPFVQYMGGATHAMLVRQNPLANIGSAAIAAAKKDPQLFVENMSRAGWNTAKIGTLTALVASQTIEMSDTDADGKTNYNGPYVVRTKSDGSKEYIPASTYGIAAGSALISAHYLNKAIDDLRSGDISGALANSTIGPLWATLRASGMDNTLSGNNMFAGLPASVGQVANNPEKDSGDVAKTIIGGLIGDVGSQAVPAVLRDIDSFFNQNDQYNPTHEKPDTSGKDPVTGKVDPIQKGIAQIKSGIPGLSNDLPRKSGELARTFGGRILNANTQSAQQKAAVAADKDEETTTVNRTADVVKDDKVAGLLSEETRAIYDKYKGDMSKASKEDSKKIWTEVTEAKDRLLEDGSYDSYSKILTYERDEAKAKGSSTETEIAKMDRDISRAKVASEKKTKPQIFRLYTGTDTPEGGGLSASEFKKMLQLDDDGNPKYPDVYDPETATLLWELDEAMTKAGASANTNGLDPWTRNKYNLDEALGRGKYASKGSGGSKDKGVATGFDGLGTYAKSPSGDLSQKYQKIANSGNAMPNLTAQSSRTNLKKNISVVKGVRL